MFRNSVVFRDAEICTVGMVSTATLSWTQVWKAAIEDPMTKDTSTTAATQYKWLIYSTVT